TPKEQSTPDSNTAGEAGGEYEGTNRCPESEEKTQSLTRTSCATGGRDEGPMGSQKSCGRGDSARDFDPSGFYDPRDSSVAVEQTRRWRLIENRRANKVKD